jgi:hypothetical protein
MGIPTTPNPAASASAVTTSDSVDFSYPARALYIGGAGNVAVVLESGTAVTFSAVPAGAILPVVCKRVNATNTTATSIVALY